MSDSTHTDGSNYGYTPSLGWAAAFITIFGLSALIHSIQAFKSKYWIVYTTLVLGALIEVLGWSARLWANKNVTLLTPFLMQICTLIMAPVFFSAYDYVILGIAIRKLGPQYSVLRPSWYFIIFIVADTISLILQAVGGGQASSSAADSAPTQSATNIMVAGIIFQLISMVVFVTLGFDFIIRANAKRPYAYRERQIAAKKEKARLAQLDAEKALPPVEPVRSESSENTIVDAEGVIPKGTADATEQAEARENMRRWWIMLGGCLISSIAIVTRGVYRSVELSQGWTSELMQTEMYQNILDGLMMVIAVVIFNFINPLMLRPKRTSWKGFH